MRQFAAFSMSHSTFYECTGPEIELAESGNKFVHAHTSALPIAWQEFLQLLHVGLITIRLLSRKAGCDKQEAELPKFGISD